HRHRGPARRRADLYRPEGRRRGERGRRAAVDVVPVPLAPVRRAQPLLPARQPLGMKARILIAVTAAVGAAAALLLGGALRTPQGAAGAAPVARAARPPAQGTEAEVRRQQAAVPSDPTDAHALTALGFAYERRMRETADPAYLTKAD